MRGGLQPPQLFSSSSEKKIHGRLCDFVPYYGYQDLKKKSSNSNLKSVDNNLDAL